SIGHAFRVTADEETFPPHGQSCGFRLTGIWPCRAAVQGLKAKSGAFIFPMLQPQVFVIVRLFRTGESSGASTGHDKERLMLKEFQEFISRGNVMDLAVCVIIGAAFGKIVDSLVNDIIMPIVGAVLGGLDFNNYFLP